MPAFSFRRDKNFSRARAYASRLQNATKRLRTWPISVPGVVAQLKALVGEPPADDGRGVSRLSVSLRFALQSANGRPGAPALTSQANDAGSAPRPGEDQAWKRN